MSSKTLTVDAELEKLQRETFGYFLHETNPCNGLVIDKTAADWPASIAATGFHGFYYHFLDMQRPAVAPGNASCRPWIAPSCWPAR
jgi:hypothetical protein